MFREIWRRFMHTMFARQHHSQQESVAPPAEREVHSHYGYDPELVPKLKEDHARLVALFTELGAQIARGEDPTRLVRDDLQPTFAGHLLLERYFYDSLEDVADDLVTDDPDTWRDFRESMKSIARTVNRYLSEVTVGRLKGEEALSKHQQIMAALGKRITDEEERLYLIYERVLGGRAAARAPREVRKRALKVVS